MTYLELVNQVLIRLREPTVTAGQVDSNPFFRSIGAHVNDAKRRVEDAWQWSSLRGTDYVPLVPSTTGVQALPNSSDGSYIIRNVYVGRASESLPRQLTALRERSVDYIRHAYLGGSVPPSKPTEYAVTGRNSTSGNINVTLFPPPEADTSVGPVEPLWELEVDRVARQADLVLPTDKLLVPSLPVYTFATALASRERGEVGGSPTSELFSVAESYLADAIAQDSAFFGSELDWVGGNNYPSRTNIRY